ncbi:MAG: WecB/TagA/CpsF family glycosyltransferase [Oscillatoriales cyanobacterium SM2_3_0]|nr:WecB/TagA/CpsF family glycosyltransferase [Oscillatoriales cyanobacterium SM2_3_0]
MKTTKILNVSIDEISLGELLEQLGSRGGVVFTPNVDHVMKLQKDREFYDIYQYSDYRVCDSKVLYYAAQVLGQSIPEKISGSDLFPAFYHYFRNCENTRIFLLGAAEGVAPKAQQKINQLVGREMVVDCYSPPFGFEHDKAECQRIIDRVNRSEATVLAVGLGSPKQEKWIIRHRKYLTRIKTILAVGATIDFEAGEKPRSPKWISEAGLEWLFRLSIEPGRLWRRYLFDDLPFVWLILQQKLNWYAVPYFSQNSPRIPSDRLGRKPLLGNLLEEAGLITSKQLDLALVTQAQADMRLGEIVAGQGWLPQETIDFLPISYPSFPKIRRPIP